MAYNRKINLPEWEFYQVHEGNNLREITDINNTL